MSNAPRAILLCLAASVALGQQVFRSTTKLVQVSVIAQDKDGKPVADLRREDFQIFDNGLPQEVQLFIAQSAQPDPALDARPPNTFTNQFSAPAGSHAGYSVILFDNLVTGFGHPDEDGTSMGRLRVLRTLQALPEGEKIALYAVGWKLQIVREFTSDRESLEQQLRTWTPAVDTADLNYCAGGTTADANSLTAGPAPKPGDPVVEQAHARASAECDRIDMARRLSSFDQQLKEMADHLSGIPGRKNLIWMANRFPITGGPAVQRLMNAGVAIYPVDEAGVCRLCPPRPKQQMRALADLTGGVAYFERNDLDVAVREAMDDGRISYTLGFYRTGEEKAPTNHQLTVKVGRTGVTLRYRSSYQTEPPSPASANPVADFVKAMNRPVDATAIALTATASRMPDHRDLKDRPDLKDELDLSVSFAISSLDLALSGGLWKGSAELVARFMTADGVQAGDVLSQTVTFNLRPATYASMLQSGALYHKEIKIPAKAVELKVLVGNLASGKIGTLTIPLAEAGPDARRK